MTVVESRPQTWIHGAHRARVNLIHAYCGETVVVAPERLHAYGDRRYVTYAESSGEGRAMTFRLVCSPPPPPYRAGGYASRNLRAVKSELLSTAEQPRTTCDVELVHPFIVVSSVRLLGDEERRIQWCRLEQVSLAGGTRRWVDVVSAFAVPSYERKVNRHYRKFYERCRAVRA